MSQQNPFTLLSRWVNDCRATLETDYEGRALSRELVRRWVDNDDRRGPSLLDPPYLERLPYTWAELLGFAVADKRFSGPARAHLVKAFVDAAGEFKPALTKGIVWLTDVLSLRHMRYVREESQIARDAMALMLDALGTIPGRMPANDFSQYQLYHYVYDLAATCLVAELREIKLINSSHIAGKRLLPAKHMTLFAEMERLAEAGRERSSGDPRFWELDAWRGLDDRRQAVVDDLFETIGRLNPEFTQTHRFPSDAVLSHARELDLAWFRLAHAVSDRSEGRRVALGLRALRSGREALFAVDHSELGRRLSPRAVEMVISGADGRVGLCLPAEYEALCDESEARQAAE